MRYAREQNAIERMQTMTSPWTDDAEATIGEIARRHGFSDDAGRAMAAALAAGNGAMAQFHHPELGGMGQWSQGGMLMIGDMFNNGLKANVGALAQALADAMARGALALRPRQSGGGSFGGFQAQGFDRWWPEELGEPSSRGAQNGQRYAVFPQARRLAIERGGRVTVHDTGDHRIGGASQQQGATSSLTFSSHLGQISLEDLPEAPATEAHRGETQPERPESSPFGQSSAGYEAAAAPEPSFRSPVQAGHAAAAGAGADPLDLICRLAELRDAGILTEEEFSAKKADLLKRL
jgi:hypothetical protein